VLRPDGTETVVEVTIDRLGTSEGRTLFQGRLRP
jgi:hypothetical protein